MALAGRSPRPRAHASVQRSTGPSSKSPRGLSSRPQGTPPPSTLSTGSALQLNSGEVPRGNLSREDGSRSRRLLKIGGDSIPGLMVTGSGEEPRRAAGRWAHLVRVIHRDHRPGVPLWHARRHESHRIVAIVWRSSRRSCRIVRADHSCYRAAERNCIIHHYLYST